MCRLAYLAHAFMCCLLEIELSLGATEHVVFDDAPVRMRDREPTPFLQPNHLPPAMPTIHGARTAIATTLAASPTSTSATSADRFIWRSTRAGRDTSTP
jgi:hypothetical protein